MKQVFIFGKPVADESFTDRVQESARLKASFEAGINTFIISPRRWGKTSLVKKVIKETEGSGIMCVFADVFKAKTPADFCELLANTVLKQTSSAFDELVVNAKRFLGRLSMSVNLAADEINPVQLQFGLNGDVQTMEELLQLPERIAEKKKVHIVICIDEFQQIAEFEDSVSFQKQLRTVWQHQENVSYCLFGSKRHMMEGLFNDETKPFYKFGDILYLKKIPFSYWNTFISGKFKASGKTISEHQIERICDSVDYHSSYVQQLSWYVYLFSDKAVSDADIEAGLEELVAQNTALFESRTENLTPVQMRFLRAVSDGVYEGFSSSGVISKYKLGSSAASVTTRKALLEKGLIYSDNNKTFLSDPVMGMWLNRP
ncbi:MAG: ATP-binding protein [Bacteroidales bacterium]|nr:ATP-binding protein [Bacteroidales bacterium]